MNEILDYSNDLQKEVAAFISKNRRICWESEYERGEYALGEKKVLRLLIEMARKITDLENEKIEHFNLGLQRAAELVCICPIPPVETCTCNLAVEILKRRLLTPKEKLLRKIIK